MPLTLVTNLALTFSIATAGMARRDMSMNRAIVVGTLCLIRYLLRNSDGYKRFENALFWNYSFLDLFFRGDDNRYDALAFSELTIS